MSFSPVAMLVEDDVDQLDFTRRILEDAGFEVQCYVCVADAREFLLIEENTVDLYVLDRRLPLSVGAPASDELGDELFKQVRERSPDARLIAFTGFADVTQMQNAYRNGGLTPVVGGAQLDLVTVFQKGQSIEFEKDVVSYRALLQSLADIEVVWLDSGKIPTTLESRLVRRVGLHFNAVSVTVRELSGGLTDAMVWLVDLRRPEGAAGTVVAKTATRPVQPGGLDILLPTGHVASTVASLEGLTFGHRLNVVQFVSGGTETFFEVLGRDPVFAAEVIQPLWSSLHAVGQNERVLTVAELCSDLIRWEEMRDVLQTRAISTPAGSLIARTNVGFRHGDLHGGNVLVSNGIATVIDLDSMTYAGGLLDPITALLSTLSHPDSPLFGQHWPDVTEIQSFFGTARFGSEHRSSAWFSAAWASIEVSKTSDRELWAFVLAYAARQLKYKDVLASPPCVARLEAVASVAARYLARS